MSSWLNREKKRQMRKNASLYEIQERFECAKAQITSAYLVIPVSILHEKYGWTVEQCNQFNIELVEKYNSIQDTQKFQLEFFKATGIGIVEVEDD